ncbi:MAG TPA: low molecular weight protein-tyrosine-phosphatase [Bacteroidia bacterium]|nr:low molecular weight protein-tyrosine-phosphatase [Bacteroidia bacterium]
MKILMVCLGNICRSPLAEAIMREKMRELNVQGYVDSAGISNYHEGDPPDERAISVANEYGIDISNQCSRPFSKSDYNTFDYIFAMDESVLRSLKDNGGAQFKDKLFLLPVFAGMDKIRNIPDPYYGGVLEFRRVFNLLNESCQKALTKLLPHS